jgi:glyoxylase-like metal-dependent hydrolase (beta-lactamase superfamily II)
MTEYTIYPLVVGARDVDLGVMTYLQNYGKRIWLPMYVFYLEGGDKKILVDTGLDQFRVPPEVGQKYGFEVMEFDDALASVGLKPEDIEIIINTHLHDDHCANNLRCPNATIYVQQAEIDAMNNPHPLDYRYFPELIEGLNVVPLHGEAEIVDGVRVIPSPGHTPGGQSVLVNTSAGTALITGFCCNGHNFPKDGSVICPGIHLSAVEVYESARRARELADILLPIHDLSVGARKRIP